MNETDLRLDRVTMTGADDATPPEALRDLSEEFPFVEWGILMSPKHPGGPRFPSPRWQGAFLDSLTTKMRVSVHLCGGYVRSMLQGWSPAAVLPVCGSAARVQLNFHGVPHGVEPANFARQLRSWPGKQFIFQVDGVNRGLFDLVRLLADVNAVPLFDASGGAGLLPLSWPSAVSGVYNGYAGGLGPDSISSQLPLIAVAANGSRVWVDMEGQIRTNEVFDLTKVRRVLEICAPHVRPVEPRPVGFA